MSNKSVLVITPTYNESENIKSFINKIIKKDLSLLIIDDNSPDGTSEIVRSLQNEFKNLYLIIREKKLGLGSAYKEGFSWGIDNGFKNLVEMDADFSHRMVDLDKLISSIESADLILGSRYVNGGGSIGWDNKRKLLSKYANLISKFVIRTKVNDLTTGFRVYTASSLKLVKYGAVKSDGYAFQIEMVSLYLNNKFNVKEVPIIFEERRLGKSKMSWKIILEAAVLLTKIFLKNFKFNLSN